MRRRWRSSWGGARMYPWPVGPESLASRQYWKLSATLTTPPRSPDYWKTISLSFGRCALTDADSDDTGTLTISRCARPASMNAIAEPVASRPTANPAAN